jgi:hypothetical protein
MHFFEFANLLIKKLINCHVAQLNKFGHQLIYMYIQLNCLPFLS